VFSSDFFEKIPQPLACIEKRITRIRQAAFFIILYNKQITSSLVLPAKSQSFHLAIYPKQQALK
jgi:precorrin-3B methylase